MKIIKRQDIDKMLSWVNKIEGNDDYRDITDQDINLEAVQAAISLTFKSDDVLCMILKSDAKNRIAFVFDTIPGEPEGFEREFKTALVSKEIKLKVGWMEDWQDLVYILQG